MHWVTEGSHCNDDYPDKECPQSRGLRRLNATDLLLYNLDVSPGETRNLSVAAFPDVVAKLTALKLAHEAEPDIFGRSEIHRGGDARLEPCPPEAVARGCVPQPGPPPTHGHANASGSGPWPQLSNMTMLVQTLPDGDPYRRLSCDTTKAATACAHEAAASCLADDKCGGFALCDWLSKCSQEDKRGVVSMFTGEQVQHTAAKPFWTLYKRSELGDASAGQEWPLCCQKEWPTAGDATGSVQSPARAKSDDEVPVMNATDLRMPTLTNFNLHKPISDAQGIKACEGYCANHSTSCGGWVYVSPVFLPGSKYEGPRCSIKTKATHCYKAPNHPGLFAGAFGGCSLPPPPGPPRPGPPPPGPTHDPYYSHFHVQALKHATADPDGPVWFNSSSDPEGTYHLFAQYDPIAPRTAGRLGAGAYSAMQWYQ